MKLLILVAIIFIIVAISTGLYFTWMNSIEKKYPYWGWGNHAGLRCKNNDNTGCNTVYDKTGQLVELK